MIKTHEITLGKEQFAKFTNNEFLITKDDYYNKEDYLLVKQEDDDNGAVLHRMTRIKEALTDEGLKEGYVILELAKL